MIIKEKGVTLISLAITVIVLMIIAGVTVFSGKETIKEAKLEQLKTNMLMIEVKARQYVEEANFKAGISPDESKLETVRQEVYGEAFLEKATSVEAPSEIPVEECYLITEKTLELWKLSKMEIEENEYYLIKFDETNTTVEIYNTLGFEGKYSLTDVEQIEL